jgi:hypothetical protein
MVAEENADEETLASPVDRASGDMCIARGIFLLQVFRRLDRIVRRGLLPSVGFVVGDAT